MTGPGRARLFVALELPPEVRERLAAWARSGRRGAGGLRVLANESQHLTLCFLGSRPAAEIDEIAEAVLACAAPAGELSIGAPLWLPPRHPRILAVEIHDDGGELAPLQAACAAAIEQTIDWEADRRAFRPHVTVARLRADAAPRDRTLPPTPSIGFAAPALVLFRSWLHPDGAQYEALGRVAL